MTVRTVQFIAIRAISVLALPLLTFGAFAKEVTPAQVGRVASCWVHDVLAQEGSWDFGDASATVQDHRTGHIYPTAGTFTASPSRDEDSIRAQMRNPPVDCAY